MILRVNVLISKDTAFIYDILYTILKKFTFMAQLNILTDLQSWAMRKTRLIAFFLILLNLLCSCSLNKHKLKKQPLRLNFTHSLSTIDPRKSGEPISSALVFMLFEGLTKIGIKGKTELALAEKIEISSDRKKYTFYLKEAYWSNGDRITAIDFEKSWKDVLSPEFPSLNPHLLYPIKNGYNAKMGLVSTSEIGVKAINEKTLIVDLEYPTPYFLELTAFCTYFPINQKVARRDPLWAENASTIVSSGPFMMKEWKKDFEIIVAKNPYHRNNNKIQLDEIFVTFVKDDSVSMQLFEKKEIDIVGGFFSKIPVETLTSNHFSGHKKISQVPSSVYCSFNTDQFPLNNKNIRKGLSLAINRQAIVKYITHSGEQVATQIVPPTLKWGDDDMMLSSHNPEQAKYYFDKGLQELKIKKNKLPVVTLSYYMSSLNKRIAQALQDEWKKTLNIDVTLKGEPFSIFVDHLSKRNYSVGLVEWIAQYNDPMDIFQRFYDKSNPKNYPSWENSTYQKYIYLSSLEPKIEKRKYYLKEAEKILLEEAPIACIYHLNHVHFVRSRVKNFFISPIGSVHFEYITLTE